MNQKPEDPAGSQPATGAARKPYATPRLIRHGTVAELTALKPANTPSDSGMSMN